MSETAYSLFGIFNVVLPVIYGEGNQAVGRLLLVEHILLRCDKVTLLAWTGSSGSHHSCLPSDLTMYNEIVPPHVPSPATMDGLVIVALRSSLPDLSLVMELYERLYHLPPLSLVAGRLRLLGIVFPFAGLAALSQSDPDSDLPVHRGTSPMLRDVEIETRDKLSGMRSALLMHPWIGPLLDQDFSCSEALFDRATCALRLAARLKQPFGALLLT